MKLTFPHWLLLAALLAAAPLQAAPASTVGTVNCATSTCHGSVAPWGDSNVLQNEYTTWLRQDKHARAYALLLNEQSRSIAAKLGLKQPAHQAKECLDCHTDNTPAARRGERHPVAEGIGCESCHGAAGNWIKSHTVAGATHAQNIANGMTATSQPKEQAKLCLSCHVGDQDRFVSHRLMGAGHPRLSFELDTFARLAPMHYRVDADWKARKGEYDGVRLWAIGQALASQRLLDTLADPKRGRDGMFPELALFDCHACHHPMSDKKWSPRLGVGPGRMRLNDSNLLMLRAIVRATDPGSAAAFSGQVAQLHQAVAGNVAGADPLQLAKALSATIERHINRLAQQRFDGASQRALLAALLDEARAQQFSDYAGAEQAYMSLSSLAGALARQGSLAPAKVKALNGRMDGLRQTLANEEKFKPDAFAAQLAALRGLL